MTKPNNGHDGRENLRALSPDEAREVGRLGGIASGKVRREKRLMKETLEALLTMPLKEGKSADVTKIKNLAALKGKNLSVQEAMLIGQVQKALRGDAKAVEFIRDTVGQKPDNKVDINGELPVVITNADKLED